MVGPIQNFLFNNRSRGSNAGKPCDHTINEVITHVIFAKTNQSILVFFISSKCTLNINNMLCNIVNYIYYIYNNIRVSKRLIIQVNMIWVC